MQVKPLKRYYINLSRNKSVERNPSWIQTIVQDDVPELSEEQDMDTKLIDDVKKSIVEEGKTPEDRASFAFIYRVFKKLLPMPFNAWLIYVQTFMLFPGVALAREPIYGLEKAISFTILLIVFNLFDTIGKYMPSLVFLNVRNASLLVWVRSLFQLDFCFISPLFI